MSIRFWRTILLTTVKFVHHHLLGFLIGAYASAALYPAFGLWIRNTSFNGHHVDHRQAGVSLPMVMLAALMFNAGLGVKPAHLKAVIHKKAMLVTALVANMAIPMAYIAVVTLVMRFWHNPQETQHILVGLALVAAMPIAGASTAWSQNSNGNLALSLGLVLFSTLLSPIVTPIAFRMFGEMASDEYEAALQGLAAYGSGGFIGFWIVLPSALGLACRFLIPESRLTDLMPFIKLFNSVDLLLLNYSNASVSLPQAVAEHDLDFLAVTSGITVGLCVVAFAAGAWLGRLFTTDQGERIALIYGLGMNNNGTGLVLASLVSSAYPRVMVPVIFYNLAQHLVAGIVHQSTQQPENHHPPPT